MDALKLTFVSGETVSTPFGPDSTLTVDTPDGVNGVKHGAWGEIANVEYVKDAGNAVAETVIPDTQTAAVATADAGTAAAATTSVTPSDTAAPPAGDPSLLQKVEDKLGIGGTHDQAVATAALAVDAAAAGAPADHLHVALDDVNAALVTWPDSTQLQDAKAQLEAQLATAPPAGA